MEPRTTPATLQDAIVYFADPDVAHDFMAALRWPNGVICPHCAAIEPYYTKSRRVWQCRAKDCRKQFTVKVGTIFEDSPLGLDKWLPCLWLITNGKNGISSYEVGHVLSVTQKTAWFMLHRVREAVKTETFDKFSGEVEADETFIGDKTGNMHAAKRARVIRGRGMVGKAAVMGVLERDLRDAHSRVRVPVTKGRKRVPLQAIVKANVEPGAALYADTLAPYDGLEAAYVHEVVNHSVDYVGGRVHTNGMENLWSLLKRAIRGTYVSVEPFHLAAYFEEQAYRFNARRNGDSGRFVEVLRSTVGKCITYKELTGKDETSNVAGNEV